MRCRDTYTNASTEELIVVIVGRSFESEPPESVPGRWFEQTSVCRGELDERGCHEGNNNDGADLWAVEGQHFELMTTDLLFGL